MPDEKSKDPSIYLEATLKDTTLFDGPFTEKTPATFGGDALFWIVHDEKLNKHVLLFLYYRDITDSSETQNYPWKYIHEENKLEEPSGIKSVQFNKEGNTTYIKFGFEKGRDYYIKYEQMAGKIIELKYDNGQYNWGIFYNQTSEAPPQLASEKLTAALNPQTKTELKIIFNVQIYVFDNNPFYEIIKRYNAHAQPNQSTGIGVKVITVQQDSGNGFLINFNFITKYDKKITKDDIISQLYHKIISETPGFQPDDLITGFVKEKPTGVGYSWKEDDIKVDSNNIVIIGEWIGKKKNDEHIKAIGIMRIENKCEIHPVNLTNIGGDLDGNIMNPVNSDLLPTGIIAGVTLEIMKTEGGLALYNGILYSQPQPDECKKIEICVPDRQGNPIEYITGLHKFFGYSIVGEESGQDIEAAAAAAAAASAAASAAGQPSVHGEQETTDTSVNKDVNDKKLKGLTDLLSMCAADMTDECFKEIMKSIEELSIGGDKALLKLPAGTQITSSPGTNKTWDVWSSMKLYVSILSKDGKIPDFDNFPFRNAISQPIDPAKRQEMTDLRDEILDYANLERGQIDKFPIDNIKVELKSLEGVSYLEVTLITEPQGTSIFDSKTTDTLTGAENAIINKGKDPEGKQHIKYAGGLFNVWLTNIGGKKGRGVFASQVPRDSKDELMKVCNMPLKGLKGGTRVWAQVGWPNRAAEPAGEPEGTELSNFGLPSEVTENPMGLPASPAGLGETAPAARAAQLAVKEEKKITESNFKTCLPFPFPLWLRKQYREIEKAGFGKLINNLIEKIKSSKLKCGNEINDGHLNMLEKIKDSGNSGAFKKVLEVLNHKISDDFFTAFADIFICGDYSGEAFIKDLVTEFYGIHQKQKLCINVGSMGPNLEIIGNKTGIEEYYEYKLLEMIKKRTDDANIQVQQSVDQHTDMGKLLDECSKVRSKLLKEAIGLAESTLVGQIDNLVKGAVNEAGKKVLNGRDFGEEVTTCIQQALQEIKNTVSEKKNELDEQLHLLREKVAQNKLDSADTTASLKSLKAQLQSDNRIADNIKKKLDSMEANIDVDLKGLYDTLKRTFNEGTADLEKRFTDEDGKMTDWLENEKLMFQRFLDREKTDVKDQISPYVEKTVAYLNEKSIKITQIYKITSEIEEIHKKLKELEEDGRAVVTTAEDAVTAAATATATGKQTQVEVIFLKRRLDSFRAEFLNSHSELRIDQNFILKALDSVFGISAPKTGPRPDSSLSFDPDWKTKLAAFRPEGVAIEGKILELYEGFEQYLNTKNQTEVDKEATLQKLHQKLHKFTSETEFIDLYCRGLGGGKLTISRWFDSVLFKQREKIHSDPGAYGFQPTEDIKDKMQHLLDQITKFFDDIPKKIGIKCRGGVRSAVSGGGMKDTDIQELRQLLYYQITGDVSEEEKKDNETARKFFITNLREYNSSQPIPDQGQGSGQGGEDSEDSEDVKALKAALAEALKRGNTKEITDLKRQLMEAQRAVAASNRSARYATNRGYSGQRVITQPGARYGTPGAVAPRPVMQQGVPQRPGGPPMPGQQGPMPGQQGPMPGQPGPMAGQPGDGVTPPPKGLDDKDYVDEVDDKEIDDDDEVDAGDEEEDEQDLAEKHKDIIIDLFKKKKDGELDMNDKELEKLLIEQIKMMHKYELLKKQWFYLMKQNPEKLEKENRENKERIKFLENKVFSILSQLISNNGRKSSKTSMRHINSKLLGYVSELNDSSDMSLMNTERYVELLESMDKEKPRKLSKRKFKNFPKIQKSIKKKKTPKRNPQKTPAKNKKQTKPPQQQRKKRTPMKRQKRIKRTPVKKNKGNKNPNMAMKGKNMYDNRLPQYIKTPPKIRSTYPIKPGRISEPFPMEPLHSMIHNNPSQRELNTLRPM